MNDMTLFYAMTVAAPLCVVTAAHIIWRAEYRENRAATWTLRVLGWTYGGAWIALWALLAR